MVFCLTFHSFKVTCPWSWDQIIQKVVLPLKSILYNLNDMFSILYQCVLINLNQYKICIINKDIQRALPNSSSWWRNSYRYNLDWITTISYFKVWNYFTEYFKQHTFIMSNNKQKKPSSNGHYWNPFCWPFRQQFYFKSMT